MLKVRGGSAAAVDTTALIRGVLTTGVHSVILHRTLFSIQPLTWLKIQQARYLKMILLSQRPLIYLQGTGFFFLMNT